MKKSNQALLNYSLGTLLLIVALNAFGGGYYGLAGAKNVPLEWLKNSPFKNYFIPSLILIVLVGGSSLIAAICVFRKSSIARNASLFCSGIIMTWIAVQLVIIGYVSWMQPAVGITALAIFVLGLQLQKPGEHWKAQVDFRR